MADFVKLIKQNLIDKFKNSKNNISLSDILNVIDNSYNIKLKNDNNNNFEENNEEKVNLTEVSFILLIFDNALCIY